MQVIEISSFGEADVLLPATRKRPEPGRGEVLIRVRAAGLNRPDIFQRRGFYPPPPGASDIPGLEVSGLVEAVGQGVEGISEGDAVCALVTGGGYASHCLAPMETLLPKPAALSFEEAAGLPETFFTVWTNVFDRAGLQAGETLLVHGGSSGIGSAAILLAKAFGANVIVTAGSEKKCDFCRGLGADLAINYKTQDFVAEALAFTGDEGVNVVLDMVAGPYTERNIATMAIEGRLVIIAFLGGVESQLNMAPVMRKRLTITGSTLRARSNAFKGRIAASLRQKVWPLIEEGAIKPPVDSIFPLAEAAKAHQRMEDGAHMGKIILKV
ncbi:MAG: NAD(P)H-quinone oxidoreductase [Sphingomonadales bacterium]